MAAVGQGSSLQHEHAMPSVPSHSSSSHRGHSPVGNGCSSATGSVAVSGSQAVVLSMAPSIADESGYTNVARLATNENFVGRGFSSTQRSLTRGVLYDPCPRSAPSESRL